MEPEEAVPLFDVQTSQFLSTRKNVLVTHEYSSSFTAFAVTINYIIGAGVLGLPYAFYRAGIPLTLLTLLFFFCFTVIGCWWVIEVLARAHGVVTAADSCFAHNRANPPRHRIGRVIYSYTETCELFGGPVAKWFCQLVLILYSVGCMWAFTATFASSLASVIFTYAVETEECNIYTAHSIDCDFTYYGCIALFALITIPLTLMDIAEQQSLQVALTIYRFVVFGIIAITVAVGLATHGPQHPGASDLLDLKWSGFGLMFPSAAFALNVHYNLPDALTPTKNKSHLKWIAMAAQLVSLLFYVLVGALCAVFFNPPLPLLTLNWAGYTGRDGGWGPGDAHWWAVAVRLLIILLPVVDLANVYPLVAITIGGNFEAALPKSLRAWLGPRPTRVCCRLASAVPPMILASVFGRLDTIFTITGLFAFALEYVIPPVIQWRSSRYCVARWGKNTDWTPFSGWYSHLPMIVLTLVAGIAAWIVAIVISACPSCFGV
eukprot:m51a1_g11959 hypothetical protein (490) ;mRNA; r:792189-793988